MNNFRPDITSSSQFEVLNPGEICAIDGDKGAEGTARYIAYKTTPDDEGLPIRQILRCRLDASARSIKRAKVAGGDSIPFFEPKAQAAFAAHGREHESTFTNAQVPTSAFNDEQVQQMPPPSAKSITTPPATKLSATPGSLAPGITLDGMRVRTNAIVAANQIATLLIDDAHLGLDKPPFPAAAGPLDVAFEDSDLLIVNKAAGQVMYPGASWHGETTLANFVLGHFAANGFKCDLHPVHRLDKETSGLVIFAKNAFSQDRLQNQLHSRDFNRTYLAICTGKPPADAGTIDAPLDRLTYSPSTFGVTPNGKRAVTHYKVIGEFAPPTVGCDAAGTGATMTAAAIYTAEAAAGADVAACAAATAQATPSSLFLVELKLETGRTHQIRIHMAHIGCPLLGDATYGSVSPLIERAALHSYALEVAHPISGELIKLKTAPPKDMTRLIPSEFV